MAMKKVFETLSRLEPERGWARRLARSLGCGCPEEVFSEIRILDLAEQGISFCVEIGGRLLIGIESMQGGDPEQERERIAELLEKGRRVRDKEEANRFRLVMLAEDEAQLQKDPPTLQDGRVHLHFLSPQSLLELL